MTLTSLTHECINPACDLPAVIGFSTCRWESCEAVAAEVDECAHCGFGLPETTQINEDITCPCCLEINN